MPTRFSDGGAPDRHPKRHDLWGALGTDGTGRGAHAVNEAADPTGATEAEALRVAGEKEVVVKQS